jgi:hypothetical protein
MEKIRDARSAGRARDVVHVANSAGVAEHPISSASPAALLRYNLELHAANDSVAEELKKAEEERARLQSELHRVTDEYRNVSLSLIRLQTHNALRELLFQELQSRATIQVQEGLYFSHSILQPWGSQLAVLGCFALLERDELAAHMRHPRF